MVNRIDYKLTKIIKDRDDEKHISECISYAFQNNANYKSTSVPALLTRKTNCYRNKIA